jgi:hypothetical protein
MRVLSLPPGDRDERPVSTLQAACNIPAYLETRCILSSITYALIQEESYYMVFLGYGREKTSTTSYYPDEEQTTVFSKMRSTLDDNDNE